MLQPLSYKGSLQVLLDRAEAAGTRWNFDAVANWLHDSSGARVLVIPAGAGTGKSSISAALAMASGGADEQGGPSPLVHAHHFLKYDDQRRLDVVRIIMNLSLQLAER